MSISSERLRAILLCDRTTSVHSAVQLFTMFSWVAIMLYSDSFVLIYIILAIIGFLCRHIVNTDKKAIFARSERANLIISSVFSLALVIANYSVPRTMLLHMIEIYPSGNLLTNHLDLCTTLFAFIIFPLLFLGGTYITFYILKYITKKTVPFFWKKNQYSAKPLSVFFSVFGLLSFYYSAIMITCFYPGNGTQDSVNQLIQVLTGHYMNNHPICHTMLIRLFFMTGNLLFHDVNAGFAFYSLFSILFVSGAVAYAVSTLYRLEVRKEILVAVLLPFLLLPEHIAYSFTMWKDIPFSASVLYFIVSVFRFINQLYFSKKFNLTMVILSSIGICMFRGNGLIVFFIMLLFFYTLFRKKYRELLISFSCVMLLALFVTFPVCKMLGYQQSDSVELLSVPIQQIARTVSENDDISQSQIELVSKVVNVDSMKQKYDPTTSDPLKSLIRKEGNKDYLNDHFGRYVLLYIQMGLTHPNSYIAAWTDETQGYWNVRTQYNRYASGILGEEIGLRRTVVSGKMQKLVFLYFSLYYYLDILKPFYNIGLYTWGILLVLFIAYRRKDKLTMFLTIPCISVIFTLLIGTPVANESRYAYSLLCCLPFLAVIVFRRKNGAAGEK